MQTMILDSFCERIVQAQHCLDYSFNMICLAICFAVMPDEQAMQAEHIMADWRKYKSCEGASAQWYAVHWEH